MRIRIPGYTTLEGSPKVILRLMAEARIFDELKGDDHIERLQQDAWRLFGISLQAAGETYEQRAESLLISMAANKIIFIEEERK